jgi:hypothetical protein
VNLQKQSEMGRQSRPDVPAPAGAAELRASDADRDRIADVLREALAEGRLTAEEHAERVDGVLNAKTVGELERFVQDLPAGRRQGAAFTVVPPRPELVPVRAEENVVAVFSSVTRRGRWRAGQRVHAYSVFGSVEIDLSEALFEYQQVVIKAVSVFGDVQIRVPENVTLRGTGGGVLGNFEVETADSTEPDAPVVYVDGWAVLGNVEARPKRGKRIADILDRVQRKAEGKLRKHL